MAEPEIEWLRRAVARMHDLDREELEGLLHERLHQLDGGQLDLVLLPAPSPSRKGKARHARAGVPEWAPELVLTTLIAACRELEGPTAGPRHPATQPRYLDHLAKLHAACDPTPDEWRAVIAHRLALSKRGESFGSLTIASLCVASNFERWLAESKLPRSAARGAAPVSRRPTESGPVDLRKIGGGT